MSALACCTGICLACFLKEEHRLLHEAGINIGEAMGFVNMEQPSREQSQGLCRKDCRGQRCHKGWARGNCWLTDMLTDRRALPLCRTKTPKGKTLPVFYQTALKSDFFKTWPKNSEGKYLATPSHLHLHGLYHNAYVCVHIHGHYKPTHVHLHATHMCTHTYVKAHTNIWPKC